MKPLDTHVLIATHGEDLAWAERLPSADITISDSLGTLDHPRAVRVENWSREASQYLRHIVDRWPHFRPWEIFLQGNPFDHCPDLLDILAGQRYRRHSICPLGKVRRYIRRSGRPGDEHAWKFAREWMGGIPPNLHWVAGAQFAVHRSVLWHRSREYYQELLEKVIAEPRTAPWAVERLWFALL
jgi:hypothetical protein